MAPPIRAGRWTRTLDLYGEEGFARIRAARFAVIGLGGVGSHAAIALARSGAGTLLLCDFDPVTESSLNRHPVAGPLDVGRAKIEVLAEYIARTCPDTRVEERREFVDAANVAAILGTGEPGGRNRVADARDDASDDAGDDAGDGAGRPALLVIDAIDSLGPKVALLEYCVRSGVPVVSSMGASSRRGIEGLRAADLSETSHCPLARLVRQRLRRRGVDRGVTCVYSLEPPLPPLAPDLEEGTLRRGRERRRQPSSICLPGIFGYALAAVALERVAAGVEPCGDPPAVRRALAPGSRPSWEPLPVRW